MSHVICMSVYLDKQENVAKVMQKEDSKLFNYQEEKTSLSFCLGINIRRSMKPN